MHTPSIISRATIASTVASAMMNSIQATKPSITIKLKGETPGTGYESATPFTTLDTIEGEITVATPTNTRFDDIQISFEGAMRIWMERYGTSPSTAKQVQALQTVSGPTMGSTSENMRIPFLTARQFLRLSQPVEEVSAPLPRIFEKGTSYTFPFMFVVPDQLLSTMCSHQYKNGLVQEAHLRLPPSLGDGTTPIVVGEAFDDLAPDMTRISYALHVRILKKRESDGKEVVISERARKLRIIPSYEDLPPTMVDNQDKDYVLRKEKDIRKGFLKGKLGKLAIEAQEPKAIHISASLSLCPATTMIPITFTFTPAASDCVPPSLSSIHTRLRTVTMYSTHPMTYFPTKSSATMDGALGIYHTASFLSSRCLAGVQWTKEESHTGPFYTTTIQVPITQPKCAVLVPTFYSCLAARTYAVELNVSINVPGSFGTYPSISLKIPVQVSSPGSPSRRLSLAASSIAGVDSPNQTGFSSTYNGEEFFRPRSIAPPLTMHIPLLSDAGSSQLPPHMRVQRPNFPPPPGYSYFAGNGIRRTMSMPNPVGIAPGCGLQTI